VNGIIAWFAHNHVAANLLMGLMIVGGLFALPSIQQRSFPDINIDVVTVSVPYLGAAPEEVEEGVCIRIEEEIQGINGIERISSTAAEGACSVGAELIPGYEVDRALSEIKNAVDAISTFPEETEKPIVSHFIMKRNAIQIALSGDVDERTLKTYGQRIRDDIAALPGVTQVDLANSRNYEISIEVAEETLRRHRLTFKQVLEAVRKSSLDMPGGSIKTRRGEILLRTKGQAYTGHDFESIVVLTRRDGTRLLLGDIANVVDGFEEDPRLSRFDGETAVLIQVFRVGDQKVLELVETVKAYVEQARDQLPAGITLTVWRDDSRSLRDRLDILTRNGRNGFILVFVLLSCFLRLRLAVWVSVGVPLSFLGALALFPALDLSIDVISLFAFILVLGLLVDDAIVVGENVHSHQERAEDPLQSAIQGTQEVAVPVIFGVLTTVAAFIPLITAPGALGQVFSGIGIVVVCCLFFSLVESQLVLPSHLGHVRIGNKKDDTSRSPIRERWKRIQAAMSGSLTKFAKHIYQPMLEHVLEWRYATVSVGAVLLMWTITVVATGAVPLSFFPPVEGDYISASVTMPLGTPVEATSAAIHELETSARKIADELAEEFPQVDEPIIKHFLASVGGQPSRSRSAAGRSTSAQSHLGEVQLELHGADGRPISAGDISRRWRDATPMIPGAEEITFVSSIFSAGEPIKLRLQSADVDSLQAAAEALKMKLAQYPGVVDITDSFRAGKEEIKLSILPSAEILGLTLEDLARQVRQAFYGEEAQRIQRDREDIRVMVRYPKSQRSSIGDLENMRIRTPAGGEVPFYSVARAELGRGFASIKRSDRQRVIDVIADLELGVANGNTIMADLRANFLPQLIADHPGLRYRLGGEQREQAKMVRGLIWGYGLAMILIYALLAIPLRSYAQPLIIMTAIPFGLIGAIGGHLLMGMGLSMMSIMGVVALSGVVVNSSLVLVHHLNEQRGRGASASEAARSAGVARFRPIALTSLSTFAGLTPLLLEESVSAQFLIPMAISLAFGVAFASTVTLFIVPSLYLVLDDALRFIRRFTRRGAAHDSGPGDPPTAAPTASAVGR
jgi:multidrug efflux pump subunit AcrB